MARVMDGGRPPARHSGALCLYPAVGPDSSVSTGRLYFSSSRLWLIFYSWSGSARRKILKSLQAIGAERVNVVPRFWPIDIDFIRLLTHAV